MATYIDFSIKTRDDLKNWILEELGDSLITVEITDKQLDHAINEGLQMYTEFADLQNEDYILLPLSGYIEGEGLPLSGYNVRSIFTIDEGFSGGVNKLFSIDNQMLNAGQFPLWGQGGSFVTYELAAQYRDMAKRMLAQSFDFSFDVRNQMLKLFPDPVAQNIGGYIILGAHIVPPEDELVGEQYVKRLALAKAKMMIGRVRKKFAGVQLPGGGTIDDSIGDEGKEEWDRAVDDIIKWCGPHNAFILG